LLPVFAFPWIVLASDNLPRKRRLGPNLVLGETAKAFSDRKNRLEFAVGRAPFAGLSSLERLAIGPSGPAVPIL